MDDKDEKILALLQTNSRLTTSQISKKTTIPITTVHNRIKKLKEEGVIEKYTVSLNYNKLNLPIHAMILVTVNYTLADGTKITQESVAKQLKQMGATSVQIVTGGTDIVLSIRAKDVESLNTFIIDKLRAIDGIDKTQTMIVLKDV